MPPGAIGIIRPSGQSYGQVSARGSVQPPTVPCSPAAASTMRSGCGTRPPEPASPPSGRGEPVTSLRPGVAPTEGRRRARLLGTCGFGRSWADTPVAARYETIGGPGYAQDEYNSRSRPPLAS